METTRAQLEELERLELALSSRIVHNSQWLPFPTSFGNSKRLTRRELGTAQWDARLLLDRYVEVAEQVIFPNAADLNIDFERELVEIDDRFQHDAMVHSLAEDLKTGRKGLDRFKCALTNDLNIDRLFTGSENCGSFVDLTRYYHQWLNLGHKTDYSSFLSGLKETLYGPEWFLNGLRGYLLDFWQRSHPLETLPETKLDGATESLHCIYCDKKFASTGVYNSHLLGRKHKANSKRERVSLERLIDALKPQLEATIKEISRRRAMTSHERFIESIAVERSLEQEDCYVSDDEPLKEDVEQPSLPLGPDGRPIPHWLYKLQGLGHVYSCEICGSKNYHGRKAFDKHFLNPEHAHGLRCLGILPSSAFDGISTIKDATELWLSLQQSSLREAGVAEREVEDEEGNVMSERVYQDLRRQGLI